MPRIPSEIASKRTVRQRTGAIERIRAAISGGDGASSQAQLRHEVARTTTEERLDLLKDAGISVPANNVIRPDTGLALKAHLALPFNKLRKLRRSV